jgi:hypothetical protein
MSTYLAFLSSKPNPAKQAKTAPEKGNLKLYGKVYKQAHFTSGVSRKPTIY